MMTPGCATRFDTRGGDSPRVLDACCDLFHAVDGEGPSVGEAGSVHVAAAERCGQPFPDHTLGSASHRNGLRERL